MQRIVRHVVSMLRRIDAALLPHNAQGDGAWLSLLYLGFLFIPALVPWGLYTDWQLTALSITAFLPIYFLYFRVRGWRQVMLLVAIVALACALVPANGFANNYIVYAGALSAFHSRRAILIGIPLALLAFAGAMYACGFPPQLMQFLLAITTVISVLAAFSTRAMVERAAKQAALLLSQEEVARLARVAERERIGRDLHDLLGHTLSVIAIKAELASKLASRDPDAARAEIADVERIAREALGQVRRAVSGMRAIGVRAEFANARIALGAARVELEYRAPDLSLHPELETVLALALREAATNIIRHADARHCEADLSRDGEFVRLRIGDDGVGGADIAGNGLRGMRERISQLGGALQITSAAGKGTQLEITLPYRAAEPSPMIDADPVARPHLRAVG